MLWLPVLGADLLSFSLTRLQKYVARALVNHLLLGPVSVFGGRESPPLSSWRSIMLKAAALGAPFTWGTYFVETALYTTALFMTAALVREIQQNQQWQFRTALEFAGVQRRTILRFSLMMLGAFAIAAVIFAAAPIGVGWLMHISPVTTAYAFTTLMSICIAYWMSPVAMLRIAAEEPRPLAARSKKAGRIFAIPSALASLLLGSFLPYIERSLVAEHLFNNLFALSAIELVLSLVTALPYVVLFIAMTLIVDDNWSSLPELG